MNTGEPRGPYRKSLERAQRLAPLLRRLRVEGVTTLSGIAQELRRRGIPPPGRRPWGDVEVWRLLRAINHFEAQRAAARALRRDRQDLRQRLGILALAEARRRAFGSRPVWNTSAEHQRRAVAALLARRSELGAEVPAMLEALVPGIVEGVEAERTPLPEWARRLAESVARESVARCLRATPDPYAAAPRP